jgi:hypothetical protein
MRFWCAVIALSAAVISGSLVQAYEEAPVESGGTIRGKITYTGRVPMRTILPTKDQQVCGQMREEPEVSVGPDGGVQDAVVYLVGVERGKAWPAEAQAPVLDNKDCIFVPNVQAIPVGKLGVHNSDPVLHNSHGFYGRRTAFNVALPNQGQTIEVDLERTGQVRVECDAHGWMLGWVYVVDNPYYAVTGEDGVFEISDVPPGEYTLVANQAYTGPVEMKVSVEAGKTVEAPVELKQP